MNSIEPYIAVALQPASNFVRHRDEIKGNIEKIGGVMEAAVWIAGSQMPVRLVTIPEGTLQGFTDELMDMRPSDYHDDIAIDVPGPESDALGELARRHNTYIAFQARTRDPNFPGHYFNRAFILDPSGEIVLTYTKLQVYYKEPSTTPIDVYDRWREIYGWTMDSLFPVADTEIGRIGAVVCYDGAFPEVARGLALNGAEIIYHCSWGEPWVSTGQWEVVNRARACDNGCYVVAPNIGEVHVMPEMNYPVACGGQSMIVNPDGVVLSRTFASTTAYISAPIDINSLRAQRARSYTFPTLKELSCEQYQVLYQEPIRQRNFHADSPNKNHEDRRIERDRAHQRLIQRGVWPAPPTA
ncbi:nitrilase-related carbon-nitrogen hydrolase [Mycolicibacterium sp. XJ2546]